MSTDIAQMKEHTRLTEKLYRVHCGEVQAEKSRTEWIALQAAERITAGEPISDIETEALDALSAYVSAELSDRAYAEFDEEPF